LYKLFTGRTHAAAFFDCSSNKLEKVFAFLILTVIVLTLKAKNSILETKSLVSLSEFKLQFPPSGRQAVHTNGSFDD
jgi:hypothetical protein